MVIRPEPGLMTLTFATADFLCPANSTNPLPSTSYSGCMILVVESPTFPTGFLYLKKKKLLYLGITISQVSISDNLLVNEIFGFVCKR